MRIKCIQIALDIIRGKINLIEYINKINSEAEINAVVEKKVNANEKIMLNLGCGSDIRDCWINIDEFSNEFLNNNLTKKQMDKIVKFDCSKGLPLKENTVDIIYSSHFFEHLTPSCAMNLFKDSYRCLKIGGIFRIALPNVIKTIKNVVNNTITEQEKTFMIPDRTMFKIEGIDNNIDYLNYSIYQWYEHKYIYNAQKVIEIMQYIGFKDVKEVSFNPEYDIDSEIRKAGSFYVEGTK